MQRLYRSHDLRWLLVVQDFFVAQLVDYLVGADVLTLTSDVKEHGLRTYAHCYSELDGRATLLLIDVSPTVTSSSS